MAYDLAKNRINILDVHSLENEKEYSYVISFEFQYKNNDGSKLWCKSVLIWNLDHPFVGEMDNKETSEVILDYVKGARAELEK